MKQRSKAVYFLMELILNCLIFAIAAAICLSLFVQGHLESRDSTALSNATIEAQRVIETAKMTEGDTATLATILQAQTEADQLTLYYDEAWQEVSAEQAVYTLYLTQEMGAEGLLSIGVTVLHGEALVYELSGARFIGDGEVTA